MKTTNNETNAERLSLIKHNLGLLPLHGEWLIEQAERLQGLEKEFAEDIDFKRREILVLKEENKRFREALKFYAKPEEYDLDKEGTNAHFVEHCHIIECGIGGKAKQALEGDKTNDNN